MAFTRLHCRNPTLHCWTRASLCGKVRWSPSTCHWVWIASRKLVLMHVVKKANLPVLSSWCCTKLAIFSHFFCFSLFFEQFGFFSRWGGGEEKQPGLRWFTAPGVANFAGPLQEEPPEHASSNQPSFQEIHCGRERFIYPFTTGWWKTCISRTGEFFLLPLPRHAPFQAPQEQLGSLSPAVPNSFKFTSLSAVKGGFDKCIALYSQPGL